MKKKIKRKIRTKSKSKNFRFAIGTVRVSGLLP